MNVRPRILCVSLTPIYRDARVLRQIGLLAQLGEVTTIGFGERPETATHHIRVPDGLSTLPQTVTGVAKLALRASKAAECSAPAAKWVLENVSERGRWDLVVANDARVLDLGFMLAAGKPVWADMHEWAPEERHMSPHGGYLLHRTCVICARSIYRRPHW